MNSCASKQDKDIGVGGRLREERVRLGLSQDALAQLGGITRNTQGSYEKGERNPDSVYFTALVKAGVDALYVLTGRPTQRAVEGLSEPEERLVQQFRMLSEYDQKAVHRIVGLMAEKTERTEAAK